jgi:hypothetical protein
MLDSLWHLRGSVPLKGIPADDPLYGVALLLAEQRKDVSLRDACRIEFDRPLPAGRLGSPSRRAMDIFQSGRIWADRSLEGNMVRYDLQGFPHLKAALTGGAATIGLEWIRGNVGLAFACLACGTHAVEILLSRRRARRLIRAAVRGD